MLRRTGYFAERTAAGALGAGEAVTDFLGTGLYTGLEKIASLGGKAPNPLSEWAGKAADSFTDNSITERYRESIDQLYHPSESEQRWGNLNEGGGQLAASILSGNGLGKVLGTGAKLLSGADKAARTAGYSQAVFGLSAAGGGLNEAVQEGASREDALKYGAASGAKEVIIENIFGGIPGLGDGKASQLAKRVVSHPAVSRILDVAGEGGEETLSTLVTPYIKRAIYDKNAKNATLEEMAESAVQGILLSGASNLGMGLASAGNRVAEVFPRPGAGAQRTAQVEKQADAVSGIFDEAESSVLLRRAGGVTTQAQLFVGEADGVLDPAARGMRRDSAEASTVQSDPENSRVLRQIAETWGRDGLREPALIENEMQKGRQESVKEVPRTVREQIPNLHAFRFDHPEVQTFYKQAARELLADVNASLDSRRTMHGVNDTVMEAAEALLADREQENYTAAKRLESVLDDMLSEGYIDVQGSWHQPRGAYLRLIQEIPGYQRNEESVSIWDMDESTDHAVQSAYQAGLGGTSVSDIPQNISLAELDAYDAGRKERIRRAENRTAPTQGQETLHNIGQWAEGADSVEMNAAAQNEFGAAIGQLEQFRNETYPAAEKSVNQSVRMVDVRDIIKYSVKDEPLVYETEVKESGLMNDEELDDWLGRQRKAVQEYGLSKEQAKSISRYVGGDAYEWTAIQLGNPEFEQTEYTEFWINLARSGFELFPDFAGRTFRNLRFLDKGKFLTFMEEHTVGRDVQLRAFTSASKDPNGYVANGPFVVHMVIDGISGKDISESFSLPQQKEVVYMPGVALHIDGHAVANDGHPIIYAREVMENGKDLGTDTERTGEGSSGAVDEGRRGTAGRNRRSGVLEGISARSDETSGGKVHQSVKQNRLKEYSGQEKHSDGAVWEASVNQAYQAGLSDLPESGVPKGATPAQRSAYEAGRAESIRKLEQELDSVSPAQAAYFGSESGLVRDEFWKRAYLSSRDSRRMDALGKVLGVQIRLAETVADGRANAKYENGVITLALDAKDPVMTSLFHESVHRIREISPESYDALSGFVQNHMSTDKLDSALEDRSRLYQTTDNAVLTEEVVADAFGVMLKDSAVLDQLVKDNRAAAEKALDVVRDIINSIRRTLHHRNLNLTRNQKSAFRDLESRLTEMEENFAQSLSHVKETADTSNTAALTQKYSLKDAVEKRSSEDSETMSDLERLKFAEGTTEEDIVSIESEVAEIPQKAREIAESVISRIIISDGDLNGYRLSTQEIYLSRDREPGTVIHEYAHAIETALNLYEDPEFLRIQHKGFENLTLLDIIEDEDNFSEPITRVYSEKLISLYQGRLYDWYGIYDGTNVLLDGMREYFSEGFRVYITEPDLLKEKDPDLFYYIGGKFG